MVHIRADDSVLVADGCRLGQQLGKVNTWCAGLDGSEGTAVFRGCFGLGIKQVDMTGGTDQVHE